jgi:hypothetical protein
MLIFLLLIQFNSLFAEYYIFTDKLFNYYSYLSLSTKYCTQIEKSSNFYYRGRPKDFKDIIDSNKLYLKEEQSNFNLLDENEKYKKYPAIFINKKEYLDYILLFPKKTLFFLNKNIGLNKNEVEKYQNFCVLPTSLNDYYSYDYIVISKDLKNLYSPYIIGGLFILFFVSLIILVIFCILICYYYKSFHYYMIKLYIYKFTHYIIIYNFFIGFSYVNNIIFL